MMLLLDGCFILEALKKGGPWRWDQWDAIINVIWVQEGVFCDLFLMENQLPLFVLHKLSVMQSGGARDCRAQGPCRLLKLVNRATDHLGELLRFTQPQIACTEINHLLHFVYSHITAACLQAVPVSQNCSMTAADIQLGREQTNSVTSSQSNYILRLRALCPSFPWSKIFSNSGKDELENDVSIIPCATELHEAGVKFRKKTSPRHTFDISFENGTLEVPSITIDGTIKIFFWNMAGFEQTQPIYDEKKFVSSYLALMDSLINTEKDVVILERAGILQNLLQNEEAAATFFNQFGRLFQLDYTDHYLHDVYKELKKYSESRWHKSRARLMHDYFNNPWSAISVVAAAILLILTVLQTYYSAAK